MSTLFFQSCTGKVSTTVFVIQMSVLTISIVLCGIIAYVATFKVSHIKVNSKAVFNLLLTSLIVNCFILGATFIMCQPTILFSIIAILGIFIHYMNVTHGRKKQLNKSAKHHLFEVIGAVHGIVCIFHLILLLIHVTFYYVFNQYPFF